MVSPLMNSVKMIVTDLDGTLLRSDQTVADQDYQTLFELGEKGIIRVIATGRSPFSFSRVIPPDFPIDYLVFSSGTGVMDFKTKRVQTSLSIDRETVHRIALILHREGVSFKVLEPVPNNHQYVYFENGNSHPDFYRRMDYYRGYETPISFEPPNFGEASQFLIILPPDVKEYNRLKKLCQGVKVVRATSPIDHGSIWMELFHPDVSKGNGVKYLCDQSGIPQTETVGIGNDYNDLDLLAYTHRSYVVDNTPDEIKNMTGMIKVRSNDNGGFTHAVTLAFAG